MLRLFIGAWVGLLLTSSALAGYTSVWSLGNLDRSGDEFQAGGNSNPPPGSATTRDNDYYFPGTYSIGTVATAEPWRDFERVLDSGDPITRIHFNLSAAQVTPQTRLRFVTHQIWGGWWNSVTQSNGEGYGTHIFTVRLNGAVIGTKTFTAAGTMIVEVNRVDTTVLVGENVLEITRSGGTPNGGISFDALTFEVHPTGIADADNDGLPRWWEEDHGFSDTNPADAAQDTDHDGLTNAQEYAMKTLPRDPDTDHDGLKDGVETGTGVYVSATNTGTNRLVADTDGDGLLDGEEAALVPRPNLFAVDTDGDGASDAWEVATGFNPTSAASTPPAFPGVIGVHFVSEVNPDNILSPQTVAGLVPQANWNDTLPQASWWGAETGSHLAINSPVADVLVNGAGAPTGVTMTWSSPSNFWANGNAGTPNQRLMDGYLKVNQDQPGVVTFNNIPYARYDVIAYVGSVYDNALAYLRLNDDEENDQYFLTGSIPPTKDLTELRVSSAAKAWRANVIRFRDVTGGSFNLKLFRTSWHEAGIHAIQIVNVVDSDGDGMPDSWEFEHKFNAASAADANLDADGDGLSNRNEYLRSTNPRLADTDGDGLSDAVETNTGEWVSVTNTGSNPLVVDTDEDGLSDGAEVNRLPYPTNPNLADTDGDGRSDADELLYMTDPVVAQTATAFMPVVTTSPRTFDWDVPNVQMIWDHDRGQSNYYDWWDDMLMEIKIANSAYGGDAIVWNLRMRMGRLTHYLYSDHFGAFSRDDNDNNDISDGDWNSPPLDLSKALGFSGYGKVDISSRLRFRVYGTSTGSSTDWNVTFSITNQDTGVDVFKRIYEGCALAPSAHAGTAIWRDNSDPPKRNRLSLTVHSGVRLFIQAAKLEEAEAFRLYKDSDNDGMPNKWEDDHLLNKDNPADAALDPDNDRLINVREYLAGTLPDNPDTDGDLAMDGLEVERGSDPLSASSLPSLFHGPPPGVAGSDLNGNGLPDAWEMYFGNLGLNPLLDADGDGVSNGDEALAGTDPFDANSRLWSDTSKTGNNLTVRWPVLNLKSHRVWQSTDLQNWSLASGSPTAFGSEFRQTFSTATSGPRMFYSVHVGDVDTDGDGVSDWDERVLGSDPTQPNSMGSPVPVDANHDGTTESSLSGDYAAFVSYFQGASKGGGFANSGSGAGSSISKQQASRFLMQAAFGPTLDEITRVQQQGYSAWMDQQMQKTPTLHSTYIRSIFDDMLSHRHGGGYNRGGNDNDPFLFGNNMMTSFARATIQGEDQLRQRVAFALSQILVVSRRDANLENRCIGIADYYDVFVKNAFGNYQDILMKVTLHPVMGRYLSHVGNQKARPEVNQYPDENYAREIMQLFTVGLWELNPDGTRKLEGGNPIPTYTNTEITQLARVMTGFWFGGHYWGNGGWSDMDFATPMSLHAERHDFGEKTLLNGFVIPARASTDAEALRDVQDAVASLFNHPNTAPFISKQLIQFLVTDNPTPAYVGRVAAVFADNGSGVRGDLGAVIKAILLDAEAREVRFSESPSFGRLKEPVVRTMALARIFGMRDVENLLWWDWGDFFNSTRQEPTYSPSVFNFYRPDYKAPGVLTQNNLASPVFQITDSYSAISLPNKMWRYFEEGFVQWRTYNFPLDLGRETALAATPEKLVDHLNLLFCAGRMSATTRALILNAVNQISDEKPAARARVAAYLSIVCPEGSVMK